MSSATQDRKARAWIRDHKLVRARWTPVEVPPPGKKRMPTYSPAIALTGWSKEAVTCLALNKNCADCPVHQVIGLSMDLVSNEYDGSKACRMPWTVQHLLDQEYDRPAYLTRLVSYRRTLVTKAKVNKELKENQQEDCLHALDSAMKALSNAAEAFSKALDAHKQLTIANKRIDRTQSELAESEAALAAS